MIRETVINGQADTKNAIGQELDHYLHAKEKAVQKQKETGVDLSALIAIYDTAIAQLRGMK